MSDMLIRSTERATFYGVANTDGSVVKLAVLYETLAIHQTAPPHEHQSPSLVGFRLKQRLGLEALIAITKNKLSDADFSRTVTQAAWDALVTEAHERYDAAVRASLLDRAREKAAFGARPHWPSLQSPWTTGQGVASPHNVPAREIQHPEGTTFGPYPTLEEQKVKREATQAAAVGLQQTQAQADMHGPSIPPA